jgi:hypothetical protein
MSDYLIMVLEDEEAHSSESPMATAELIDKRAQFVDELRRAGRLRDGGRLRPSREGTRVRASGGALNVETGPFAEGGKALGAYYWVRAAGVDEAARIAAECPALASDEIEVRPLMKGDVATKKDAKPGKIFALAVLGNTSTEEAWVKIMDQIDADTSARFPADSFLGGLRLQPPRTGKRVATRAAKRAIFDGPFLESKEVIGGVFFLRMASAQDAIEWAGTSSFVAHGVLEIRELWRS